MNTEMLMYEAPTDVAALLDQNARLKKHIVELQATLAEIVEIAKQALNSKEKAKVFDTGD